MKTYTPKQWLLIDLASKHGMDKNTYDERLMWGREVLEQLRLGSDGHEFIYSADEPALFAKALLAIKDTLLGQPTGHVVGLDAAASGPQLLSVLTHCETGMRNTGALNSGSVPDLYTLIQNNMQTTEKKDRDLVKQATIPYVYGSDVSPITVFGDDADKFVEAYEATVPYAAFVRRVLLDAWDESAYFYEYSMPDGAIVYLECKINDDFKGTMNGYTYTYRCSVNRPIKLKEKGSKALGANVTHSMDAFVVREIGARCHYNTVHITRVVNRLEAQLQMTDIESGERSDLELHKLQALWERYNFLSVAALDVISTKHNNLGSLSTEYLTALLEKAKWLLEYPSFQLFTIHDEFKCSPNHVERMRKVYNSIIAELYKSPWLFCVIEDLTGQSYEWSDPIDEDIYQQLLNAEYAIG